MDKRRAEKWHETLAMIALHITERNCAVGDQFLRLRIQYARMGGRVDTCPFGPQVMPFICWRGNFAYMARREPEPEQLDLFGKEAMDED